MVRDHDRSRVQNLQGELGLVLAPLAKWKSDFSDTVAIDEVLKVCKNTILSTPQATLTKAIEKLDKAFKDHKQVHNRYLGKIAFDDMHVSDQLRDARAIVFEGRFLKLLTSDKHVSEGTLMRDSLKTQIGHMLTAKVPTRSLQPCLWRRVKELSGSA